MTETSAHALKIRCCRSCQKHTTWLDDPKMRDALLAGPLLGRGAQPEEMVLYLCSPLASFVTGQTFTVGAGQTINLSPGDSRLFTAQ
jgi:NAD(P)-dependent dehydrogenase (short-subunit alcohol dehydrogenase family)